MRRLEGKNCPNCRGLATREAVLAVERLSKSFGGLHAVEDVSFRVMKGAIHAVIGPNGAGKTTMFNLITGLVRPDHGKVLLNGDDVTGYPPWQLVERGLGRSFQHTTLFWSLSAQRNVVLAEAAATGVTIRPAGRLGSRLFARADGILKRVNLRGFSAVPAIELSHGCQRSLELADALAINSTVLLLDEPTAGLSPQETSAAVEMIRKIATEDGLTVLFIEHDMEVVFRIADRITVLHQGKILAEGTPQEIRRNAEVKRAYLGDDVN